MLIFKSFNIKITMNNNNMLHIKFHKLINIIFLVSVALHGSDMCHIQYSNKNIPNPFKLIMR